MNIKRRRSRQIKIGRVGIGGRNPIVVQSMAKTFTCQVASTLREIRLLRDSGAQVVRLAVRDNKDAAVLKTIKRRVSVPLVADIHFDKNLAIKAIESGMDKIRLNPGNIYKDNEVREIARAAKQAGIPIRVGVNSGSLRSSRRKAAGMNQAAGRMVACALDYIRTLEKAGFYKIVVSLKSSDILTTIQANEIIAKSCDYPLHLGVTASGPSSMGIIKSAVAIGRLLSEGIGDTIRVSLTDQATAEVRAALYILQALGLKQQGPQIISCPTCGRCEVDLIRIVNDLEQRLSSVNLKLSTRPIKLAVMGCVVNGPGEAREADLGIAFGKNEGLLFKKGKPISKIPASKCTRALLSELEVMGFRL